MASFWSVDGEDLTKSDIKEKDSSFKPLPAGWYQGFIEEIKIKEGELINSISAKLSCKVGDEMKKVFITLKCWDSDPSKRKRNIQMLLLMFRHAGKEIPKEGPDDYNLKCLISRKMGFNLDVYEMTLDNGEVLTGNWLRFVSSSDDAKEKSTPIKKEGKKWDKPLDDDIDF